MPATWTSRNGDIPITDLTDAHLHNVHFYLLRKLIKEIHTREAVSIAFSSGIISKNEFRQIKNQIDEDIIRHETELNPIREEVKRREL